jgi:hypothetical protein
MTRRPVTPSEPGVIDTHQKKRPQRKNRQASGLSTWLHCKGGRLGNSCSQFDHTEQSRLWPHYPVDVTACGRNGAEDAANRHVSVCLERAHANAGRPAVSSGGGIHENSGSCRANSSQHRSLGRVRIIGCSRERSCHRRCGNEQPADTKGLLASGLGLASRLLGPPTLGLAPRLGLSTLGLAPRLLGLGLSPGAVGRLGLSPGVVGWLGLSPLGLGWLGPSTLGLGLSAVGLGLVNV